MSFETEAYKLALKIISDAKKTSTQFVNLSPLISNKEKRRGFESLAELIELPKEIGELTRLTHLELRGTSIRDLSPLLKLPNLKVVDFYGIDASYVDEDIKLISELEDGKERTILLFNWLAKNSLVEPPEQKPEGPQFFVPEQAPIYLLDKSMFGGGDDDQLYLQDELKIKSTELMKIASLSDNVAPRLSGAIIRYQKLIHKNAAEIGARSIWSHANTLESVWQVHSKAVIDFRDSDILPSSVAACLEDLLLTHRVWFLGHEGARDVEERASSYRRDEKSGSLFEAAAGVVMAADRADILDRSALLPALSNMQTAADSTPSGTAALGELEDWTWNLIAATARKIWLLAHTPPGGVLGGSVAGAYLTSFIMQNELALGAFAKEFMSYGPIWWETVLNLCRRFNARSVEKREE